MTTLFTNAPIPGAASNGLVNQRPKSSSLLANHLQKYPNARSSTLAHFIERERVEANLRGYVEAKRRAARREHMWSFLWPIWLWWR